MPPMIIPIIGINRRLKPKTVKPKSKKEIMRMLEVAHFRMPFRGTTPITSTPAAGDTYVTITS
jgi:hypothetical protein